MLATSIHGLQGTPYVFQGEEIGMPNPRWNSIDEFRDIESLNMYRIMQEQGKTADEAFAIIVERSRDNARTPMQWDDSPEAGFTTGKPWIKVDDRYPEINAKVQLNDPDSVYSHYKRLIALRKQVDVLTDGQYVLMEENHPQIYAYARMNADNILIIASNFSNERATFTLPSPIKDIQGTAELLIGNTKIVPTFGPNMEFEPYASYMWLLQK
jgi:trehalose-6-phosphate hydrolase